MFYQALRFNGNLGTWDTSAVTDMSGMFWKAGSFNQNISNWDTAKVTDMTSLLSGASKFNQELCWARAQARRDNIFDGTACPYQSCWCNVPTDATIQQAVSDWCAGETQRDRVESTYGPIANWDTAFVTKMNNLFQHQSTCNPDIGNWSTVKVTNMNNMFDGAKVFNQPIGRWNTAKVTSMMSMFYNASAFNQDLDNWNTAQVTLMTNMFFEASVFNQNIGSWSTAKVTNMHGMFFGASKFNQALCWTRWAVQPPDANMFVGTGCPLNSQFEYDANPRPLNCWGQGTPLLCSPTPPICKGKGGTCKYPYSTADPNSDPICCPEFPCGYQPYQPLIGKCGGRVE